MHLENDEVRRYARHLLLPEVGREGQLKLKGARVLCIGAGGLGSPLLIYLAAAGIGRLGIIDFDVVDLSNLQRQILHRTADIGRAKTESAQDAIRQLNPHVNVVAHAERLSAANALNLFAAYDVVVDASDNFPTRYLANDACVFLGKPNVYGAIFRFEGQATVFFPAQGGPCYRCLYPEPPPPATVPNCAEAGVLGVLPGIVGCVQAIEVIKLILGQGNSLAGRFLLFNALEMKFRELKLKRDPRCPVCGTSPTITQLIDYEAFCGMNTPASEPGILADEVTVHDMQNALRDPSLHIRVVDVREPEELAIAHIGGVDALPLSVLPQRFRELDPNQLIYLHCKSGGRSLKAVKFLQQRGYRQVKSVKGGITAWSTLIDPQVPQY